MLSYLTRRILYGLLTIWAVSILSFTIIPLPPGDYVTSYIAALEAQGDEVSAEEAATIRAYFGLGQPIATYCETGVYQCGKVNWIV